MTIEELTNQYGEPLYYSPIDENDMPILPEGFGIMEFPGGPKVVVDADGEIVAEDDGAGFWGVIDGLGEGLFNGLEKGLSLMKKHGDLFGLNDKEAPTATSYAPVRASGVPGWVWPAAVGLGAIAVGGVVFKAIKKG